MPTEHMRPFRAKRHRPRGDELRQKLIPPPAAPTGDHFEEHVLRPKDTVTGTRITATSGYRSGARALFAAAFALPVLFFSAALLTIVYIATAPGRGGDGVRASGFTATIFSPSTPPVPPGP